MTHPEPTTATKQCKTCNQVLPLDAFHRNLHAPMGRLAHCKVCLKARYQWSCPRCGAVISRKGTLCRPCAAQQRGLHRRELPNRGGRAQWTCKGCGNLASRHAFQALHNGRTNREGFSRYCDGCRGVYKARGQDITPPNPSGVCQCGCGQTTPRATQSDRAKGLRKGEYVRFMPGHTSRAHPKDFQYVIDPSSGCWLWQGRISANGYGRFWNGKATINAHRAVYEAMRDVIAPGLELDHLCRNKQCVNPEHMEPVTRAENVRRGKAAKLTVDIAEAVRERWPEKGLQTLANEYGVSATTIRAIVRGHTWRTNEE